jgi:hypothetical protein
MSLNFNLLEDTKIVLDSNAKTTAVSSGSKSIPTFIAPAMGGYLVFVGQNINQPTYSIASVQASNNKSDFQVLTANTPVPLNSAERGDIIEIKPNTGQPIFANSPLTIDNQGIIRITITDPTQPIIITEAHGFAVTPSTENQTFTITGTATLPQNVSYFAPFDENRERMLDGITQPSTVNLGFNVSQILPYNTSISLTYEPSAGVTVQGDNNEKVDLFITSTTSNRSLSLKSITSSGWLWVFVVILVLVLFWIIFNNKKKS